MEDNNKKQEFYYLNHWDISNLYGWGMPQKLPVDGFKWVGNISFFNKDFIKNYNEHIDEEYFVEVHVNMPKNYIIFIMISPFRLKELKSKKL